MKKLLALILVFILLFSCAAAEEANAYYFDPASIEGIEGYHTALGNFGLQMFIPASFVPLEVSEKDAAQGCVALLGSEDGRMSMSIIYADITDANGNVISNLDDLSAFYTQSGITTHELAFFNDLPALYYMIFDSLICNGLALIDAEGHMIAITIVTTPEEDAVALAATMLSSVMACEK